MLNLDEFQYNLIYQLSKINFTPTGYYADVIARFKPTSFNLLFHNNVFMTYSNARIYFWRFDAASRELYYPFVRGLNVLFNHIVQYQNHLKETSDIDKRFLFFVVCHNCKVSKKYLPSILMYRTVDNTYILGDPRKFKFPDMTEFTSILDCFKELIELSEPPNQEKSPTVQDLF
ncbi:unnamed protein product [marine sediment metagenome]|uniref:Uncharacterized protein n=1 Tax=marine sediment metagenome TaxID=412755 RepID=X1DKE1_9ZZZZ